MTRFDNAIRLKRQADPTSPAAGLDALFADANGRIKTTDPNGVDQWLTKQALPGHWQAGGHSYFDIGGPTFFQTGRADAIFRSVLGVEYGSWRNRAVSGAMLAAEGRAQGGWARWMQEVVGGQRSGPYVSDIGASVLCWGINDIGKIGSSTQAQIRTMFQNALRAVISRARCSVYFDNGFAVGTRTTYGAGFAAFSTSVADYSSSAGTLRRATSTTSATITLTLPSDYNGETVVTQFIAQAGTAGATMTYSGTAGVTGALVVSGIVPSGAGIHVPVVRRITNLTSANAGQTIVMTAGSLTTSVLFDGWWLETNYPPPVLVCNAPRVQTAGYSIYANSIGDSDITALNATILSVIGEFDSMVALADIDTAMNKDTSLFASDGLHPNELGSARIADTLLYALYGLVVDNNAYPASNLNTSSPRAGTLRRPRLTGLYYGPEAGESFITANPVVGQMWAAPYVVTGGREWSNRAATRLANGGSTAGSIRWGIYDDPDWDGYPQNLLTELTAAGALSLGTTPGIVQSPTSGSGSISWTPDPGLYWLIYKQVTQGTDQEVLCLQGPDRFGIMPQLDPSTLAKLDTPISWVLGGQGTGALPSVFPLGATVDFVFPIMALLTGNVG